MSRNPQFEHLAKELSALHDRKNEDYSGNRGHYFNFEFAADFAKHFTSPIDRVFATLLGVKYARLIVLTAGTKKPNNESIEDTRKDIANYGMIWASYYQNLPAEQEAICNAVTDALIAEGLGHEVSEQCLDTKPSGLGRPVLNPATHPDGTVMYLDVRDWTSEPIDRFCRAMNGVYHQAAQAVEFTYRTQLAIRNMKWGDKTLSLWLPAVE